MFETLETGSDRNPLQPSPDWAALSQVKASGHKDGAKTSAERDVPNGATGTTNRKGRWAFRRLRSMVRSNRERGKDAQEPVQAGRSGRKKVSGVIRDKGLQQKRKGKVYDRVVPPAMFGLEALALIRRQEAELKMIRLDPLQERGGTAATSVGPSRWRSRREAKGKTREEIRGRGEEAKDRERWRRMMIPSRKIKDRKNKLPASMKFTMVDVKQCRIVLKNEP